MKRVISLFIIGILMIICLTGCVTVNYGVTINEDGSADVSYVYGFEKSVLESLETTADDMTADMKQESEESGYTIETYSDDLIEGFKATKHINSVSELSLEEAFKEENVKDSEDNQIRVEAGKKYYQNATIDLTSMKDMSSMGIKMTYSVTLPIKAGENNADTVSEDGKTLTWNLTAGETRQIHFEAVKSNNIMIYASIGVAVVLVVIIVLIIVRKTKGKAKKEEDTNRDMTAPEEAPSIETEKPVVEEVIDTVKEEEVEEVKEEPREEKKEDEEK